MNVKDFITQHPGAALDMMTPGGYVYLTPEKAQALLGGESTTGHPGSPEYAMEIPAEELLSQHIHSANYSKGVWHMLTSYDQEEGQDVGLEIDAGIRKQDVQLRLFEKLDKEYAAMVKKWLGLEPSLLIEQAEQIAVTKMVYDELKSGEYIDGHMDELEHLLRFENPLEALRDEYIRQDTPQQYIMDTTLWELMQSQPDIEQEDAPEVGGCVQGMQFQ